jgi:hypothetical protein
MNSVECNDNHSRTSCRRTSGNRREFLGQVSASGALLVGVPTVLDSVMRDAQASDEGGWYLADFMLDVTIPIGHRCMGVLPTKSKSVADALELHGFVLFGDGKPVVVVALDWCEIRNGSYDRWRERLARAAKTDPDHVLLSCLHQHDAPVIDEDAQRYLDQVGLRGELFDPVFHEEVLVRTEQAVVEAIGDAAWDPKRRVTDVGFGQVAVRDVASNRRIVQADGKVTFARGSSSGRDPLFRDADEGLIDPMLRTVSFWNGDRCLLEYHTYATHPMSYYGRGEVTSDFVGLARKQRQRETRGTHQMYASGCSGDVTAGKYNDGTPEARVALTEKIREAMQRSATAVSKSGSKSFRLRSVPLELPYTREPGLQKDSLLGVLKDTSATTENRILAAMGLASIDRAVEKRRPIDLVCLDLDSVRLVLFPGESFVGYQGLAQRHSGGIPVLPIGYGECWTGYVPTESAFADGFHESWLWVDRGAEAAIDEALQKLLSD